MEEQSEISKEFSEESFLDKVKNYAKQAGKEAIEKAFMLYFALNDPNVPAWAKGVVAGALGYFISPLDAIPDIIPAIGYTDDLGVMVAAVAAIAVHLSEETKAKAIAKSEEWFG